MADAAAEAPPRGSVSLGAAPAPGAAGEQPSTPAAQSRKSSASKQAPPNASPLSPSTPAADAPADATAAKTSVPPTPGRGEAAPAGSSNTGSRLPTGTPAKKKETSSRPTTATAAAASSPGTADARAVSKPSSAEKKISRQSSSLAGGRKSQQLEQVQASATEQSKVAQAAEHAPAIPSVVNIEVVDDESSAAADDDDDDYDDDDAQEVAEDKRLQRRTNKAGLVSLEFDDEYCETDLELEYSDDEAADNVPEDMYRQRCKELGILPSRHYLSHCDDVHLELRHVGFNFTGAKALAAGIAVSKMTQLDLSGNQLRCEEVEELVSAIKGLSSLQDLNLSRNNLGGSSQHCQPIANLLSGNTTLKSLNLSSNGLVDQDIVAICQPLEPETGLVSLSLACNKLGEISARCLARVLESNQQLQKLDVSWNQFRLRGATLLAAALPSNVGLEELDLGWNGFADPGAKALADALRRNTTLKKLSLANNRITMEGCEALARVLQAEGSSNISTLDLSYNPISQDAISHMVDLAIKNTSITELNFKFVPAAAELRARIAKVTSASPRAVAAQQQINATSAALHRVLLHQARLLRAKSLIDWARDRANPPSSLGPYATLTARAMRLTAMQLFCRLASPQMEAAFTTVCSSHTKLLYLSHNLAPALAELARLLVCDILKPADASSPGRSIPTTPNLRAPSQAGSLPITPASRDGSHMAPTVHSQGSLLSEGFIGRFLARMQKQRPDLMVAPVEELKTFLLSGALSLEATQQTAADLVESLVLGAPATITSDGNANSNNNKPRPSMSLTAQAGGPPRTPAGPRRKETNPSIKVGQRGKLAPPATASRRPTATSLAANAVASALTEVSFAQTVEETDIQPAVDSGAAVIEKLGGNLLATWLKTYIDFRVLAVRDRASAMEQAGMAASNMLGLVDEDEPWMPPPGWETFANGYIAVEVSARKTADTTDRQAVSEAVAHCMNSLDSSAAAKRPDLLEVLTQIVYSDFEFERQAKIVLDEVAAQVTAAQKEQDTAATELANATEADFNEDRRPALSVTVGQNGLASEACDDPWLMLETYLERHELRFVELFQRFDAEKKGSVSRADFIKAIKDVGVKLQDAQIEQLLGQQAGDEIFYEAVQRDRLQQRAETRLRAIEKPVRVARPKSSANRKPQRQSSATTARRR